jgi:hypothetical protein
MIAAIRLQIRAQGRRRSQAAAWSTHFRNYETLPCRKRTAFLSSHRLEWKDCTVLSELASDQPPACYTSLDPKPNCLPNAAVWKLTLYAYAPFQYTRGQWTLEAVDKDMPSSPHFCDIFAAAPCAKAKVLWLRSTPPKPLSVGQQHHSTNWSLAQLCDLFYRDLESRQWWMHRLAHLKIFTINAPAKRILSGAELLVTDQGQQHVAQMTVFGC